MAHAYTEDQLVEQRAIGLFPDLGLQTVAALEETFGVTGTLPRLNTSLQSEVITAAADELVRSGQPSS